MTDGPGSGPAQPLTSDAARAVHAAFADFHAEFNAITRRARSRFESREWLCGQNDALERLGLYPSVVQSLVADLQRLLGASAAERELWTRVKQHYSRAIAGEPNAELAKTFFSSVTRKVFSTVGVNPDIEFVSPDETTQVPEPDTRIISRHMPSGDTQRLVRSILEEYRFDVDYRDLDGDAAKVARRLDAHLRPIFGGGGIEAVETLRPIFFRNKGAYIIGRIRTPGRVLPLVLPLLNSEDGICVDALLIDTSEVSILFSFTRSSFHVEAERPAELIAFLRSILPLKPVAELYISLGFHKHGKTELYRGLKRRLDLSAARFEVAPGDRGMVMLVFSLPLDDRVFKVIRDVFDYPKHTTAREVRQRYRLVFERDRVGRLVEAQEFEHLRFRLSRFTEELLVELRNKAARRVKVQGDHLVIEHLYMERKVRPLNLYLREVGDEEAVRAVVDYGHAIKELAAANIFPGDFLLKNFGVTRHHRVVFYDYDELCLLTDCNFRTMPAPKSHDEELDAEPWFSAADNDIFPEEFRTFLDLRDPLLRAFERHHGELFTVEFWHGMQQRHRAGEVLDFYPYPPGRRLGQEPPEAA